MLQIAPFIRRNNHINNQLQGFVFVDHAFQLESKYIGGELAQTNYDGVFSRLIADFWRAYVYVGYFKNNLRHGVCIQYSTRGELHICSHLYNQKHGFYVNYQLDQSDNKLILLNACNYRYNELHGLSVRYKPSGKIFTVEYYPNGLHGNRYFQYDKNKPWPFDAYRLSYDSEYPYKKSVNTSQLGQPIHTQTTHNLAQKAVNIVKYCAIQ